MPGTPEEQEPAQPCPDRLALKQQKNMVMTRRRAAAMPAEQQQKYKRIKSAKELHVGLLPGVLKPTSKGKTRHRVMANISPVARPSQVNLSPEAGPSPRAPTPSLPRAHSPAAFMDTAGSSRSSPALSCLSADLITGDIGSDVDAEDQEADDIGVDCSALVRLPTLATDSPAVLPEVDPKLTIAIDQMDRQNDNAIRAILPIDRIVFDWRSDITSFTGVREEFTGTPGPTFPMSEIESPVNVFLKIWDQEIMSLIEIETNYYAAQHLAKPDIMPSSRIRRWHPTNVHELYVFFALMIHQSLSPTIVEAEYFYPTSRVTAMPYFKEYMPYNRFIMLKKFLHFANNGNIPQSISLEERRLYKIQPVCNHLNRKFQDLYLPGQNVAIDESLLKWQGHLSFIQKIAKAAKSGIKSYELCESDTGYLWKFTIYAGKDTTTDRQDQLQDTDQLNETDRPDRTDLQPARSTAKVVYDLAHPLFEKGYTLIMDNYYNSPLLARSLKLRGTDCYGTLRLKREYVPDSMKSLTKELMRTGEVVSSTSGDLNVIIWMDVNVVSMLSTYHKVEIGAGEKYGSWKFKPQVVLDYNKNMGGVDKKDQMLSNFPLERSKNSCWYKKLFRRLLNVSLQNAFIIYKCKDKSITHRNFRIQVADGLLKMFYKPNVAPQTGTRCFTTSQLPSVTRGHRPRPVLEYNHFPQKIPDHPKQRRCVWCTENKKRSRTVWQCDVCEVPLCVECFKPYHTGVRVTES